MALRTKTPPAATGLPGLPQPKDRNPILVVGGAIGRAIVNVVVLAVLAAAALGGWLAADEYLIPRIEGSVSVGAVSEWPPELGAAAPWPVYETNWTAADGSRASVIYEPATDTVVAATTVAEGVPARLVEWSGPLMAVQPTDGAWEIRTGVADQEDIRTELGARIVSPRLADVLAGGVARHAIVREVTGQGVGSPADAEVGIVRFFEVTVDTEAFRRDDPIAFGRSHPRVSDRGGVFTWTIGTDSDGRIMRWDGIVEGASVSLRPVELPELQSPIATQVQLARNAATAPESDDTDPAPDGTGSLPVPVDGSIPSSVDETVPSTAPEAPAPNGDPAPDVAPAPGDG